MNERKSFQIQKNIADNKNMIYGNKKEFYQQYNKKKSNEVSKKDIKSLKNKNGITLIALVISIIVMLILVGVSLNATIGNNGIITQVQNATYMQSIAALEEYLQTEYVKYYDESDDYSNKPELLNAKIKNLLLKDGTRDYIIYDGKIYYLINKLSLPEEIKNQLKGGDTNEWAKYIRLQDVYGITSDLKVYYCNMENGTVLGDMNAKDIDPNQPVNIINNDTNMKQAITSALAKIGISVDNEIGITNKDVAKIRELKLDGTEVNLTSLKGLSEIRNIQKLVLKNLNLDNLEGLENLTKLYYIFLENCNIKDYSNLCNDWGLQYIYMYLPTTMSEEIANLQVSNLGKGLANASNLNKLTHLGISGYDKTFDEESNFNGVWVDYKSKLTDISGLENINDVAKKSVKYLYLNNNQINDLQGIANFTSVYEITLGWTNIINVNGLEKYKEMESLWVQNCVYLTDISALTTCDKLKFASITQNSKITNLNGLEGCKELNTLYLWGNSLTDITALQDCTSLYCLYLTNVKTLQNVSTLGTLTGLRVLHLRGTSNMIETEVRDALANPTTHIAENCGMNFSIDEKYQLYFLDTITSFDYSVSAVGMLNDDDTKINQLKYKKQVRRLNLTGQTNLSNTKLQEILSTMTGLEFLSLNGCSQLSSLDFIGKDNSSNNVKVTNLVELDLRGVASSLTDLSNLNEYGKNIQTLVVDNPSIDVTVIQTAISTIGKTARSNLKDTNDSWIDISFWKARGTIFLGETSNKKYNFNMCTDIPYFTMLCGAGTESKVKMVFDFSNIKNDVDFTVYSNASNLTIKLPVNCGRIDAVMNSINLDLSNSIKIKEIALQWCTDTKFKNMFQNANKNLIIEKLYNFRNGPENLDFLQDIDASKINTLAFYGNSRTDTLVNLNDFSNLKLCTNLKRLQLFANSNLTNLNTLKDCRNVTCLDIRFCSNLSSLSGIENLTELTELYCEDSSISDISAMSNLKNLQHFSINKNNVTDIQALEGTINDNKKIKYTELNLSNNPISGYSENGHNNIETLKILKKAGLVKVNVYKTSFSDNDIAQIIDIFGKDNVTTDKEW